MIIGSYAKSVKRVRKFKEKIWWLACLIEKWWENIKIRRVIILV